MDREHHLVTAKDGRSGRGVGFADFDGDGDGDLDVVVLNSRREPTLLRNDSPRRRWIAIDLRGTTANRFGVGARVKVVAGDLVQVDEVHSGRGYQSHWGLTLHFGLGGRSRVDRIEVRWPGGGTQTLEGIDADRRIVIRQGMASAGKALSP